MRLNKFISNSGVCSRRIADEYIVSGRVKINKIVVRDLGKQIDELKDIIEVDGKIISLEDKKVYIMLNKPVGYVTTSKEQFNRPSVLDLINEEVRVYSVGRLDMDSKGLLLLTNDGDFANKLMHPKNKIKKVYEVILDKDISDESIQNLTNGVDIGGYITRPADVQRVSKNKILITIAEGKNRQVRKMCNTQGLDVLGLNRIQIGELKLGDLEIGKYRYVSEKELDNIVEKIIIKQE